MAQLGTPVITFGVEKTKYHYITRAGSVLKPKPKPRFSVKTEPKP